MQLLLGSLPLLLLLCRFASCILCPPKLTVVYTHGVTAPGMGVLPSRSCHVVIQAIFSAPGALPGNSEMRMGTLPP